MSTYGYFCSISLCKTSEVIEWLNIYLKYEDHLKDIVHRLLETDFPHKYLNGEIYFYKESTRGSDEHKNVTDEI